MHTIIQTISGDPKDFQKELDMLVEELCNQKGYQITQISNLVQSEIWGATSDAGIREWGQGKMVTQKKYALSQTFVFTKN